MKYKSPIFSQASGSLAGTTFSRNKGGLYVRSRATPTNPNSTQQQAVRNIVGGLSNHWVTTLTNAQRSNWKTYADNVGLLDALGESINVTGLGMYVRGNAARIQAGLARVDDAPSIFDVGEFTDPSFEIDTANQEVDVTFDDGDGWANEDDAAMLVYASRAKNPSVNYHKGPYRFAGKIDGDAMTPPTSPASLALPFSAVEGQRVFFRVQVTRADGRYSSPFRGLALAPAAA